MNGTRDIELTLRQHLANRAETAVGDGQLATILEETARSRQRPGWLASLRLGLRDVPATARGSVPPALWVAVGATLVILMLGLAAFVARQPAPPPPPFNGLILFGRFEEAAGDTVVYTIHPDGTGLHQVEPDAAESPHWSPDGRRLLFGDRILTPDGVVLQRYHLGAGSFHIECPFFSPDETRLVCEGFDDDLAKDAGVHGIYTVRASDGGDLVRVTAPGDFGVVDGYVRGGSAILFHRPDAATQRGPMYVIGTDGTDEHRLGTIDTYTVTVAPDGRSVLAASQGQLYRIDLGTSQATAVSLRTIPLDVLGAAWSPDQTRLLLRRLTAGQIDLFTANADGSGLIRLTNDANDDRFFDWGTHPLAP